MANGHQQRLSSPTPLTLSRYASRLCSRGREKQAEGEHWWSNLWPTAETLNGPPRTPAQQQQIKQDALKKLTSLLFTGAGVGIAGRSLLGLKNVMAPAAAPDPYAFTSPIQTPLQIPTHTAEEEEERRRLQKRADKPGATPVTAVPPLAVKPPSGLEKLWADAASMLPENTSNSPLMHSWGIPAAIGAAGVGVGGGWWLTDWLAKKREQAKAENETTDAEQDYQKALAEQYRAAMRAKTAEATLGIDDLFDKVAAVKQADPWGPVDWFHRALTSNDTVEKLKGIIAGAALVAGGGSAYAMYNATKDRSRKAVMDRALKLRARQRQMGTPIPFAAIPTPLEA